MPVCAAPCFSNRAPRDTKKPFTFSFLSDRHFVKETRSLKYLNFPAKLQAELFDVTHTFSSKMAAFSCRILGYFRERFRRDLGSLEAKILVNNIFLYKLFIGVKKINGHSRVL